MAEFVVSLSDPTRPMHVMRLCMQRSSSSWSESIALLKSSRINAAPFGT